MLPKGMSFTRGHTINVGRPRSEETRKKISEAHKGMTHSVEARRKISISQLGRIPWNKGKRGLQIAWNKGREVPAEERLRLSKMALGRVPWNKGKKRPEISGSNHYAWKEDRSSLKKKNERNDSAYKDWRKQVRNRDNWECMMRDENCNGKVVAHHILPWSLFPDLRYEINNGITLCRFHHPRKRDDEMKLAPLFSRIVEQVVAN